MSTVHGWIRPIHDALGIATPTLPVTGDERAKQQSPSLDGVFVLGQGSLLYDSAPIGFSNDEYRQRMPNASWQAIDMPNGNLALLFLLLTVSVSGVSASWLNPAPYLARSSVQPIKLLP